ncbi:hypothetical protein [Methylotenera mobilis]|uniref:Low-complexity protein n=1 Tax=Methylotenera mobilis (strain JLW8 / ATCC BAA-1282 / DSM 17540) TaxID=583345 RepID=C6WYE9_METML|nr:hypothetical protein [Methylotenera mobilis]ACT48868.1 conserved hypothetical protein [Methylotenera mobilis JLW8]
MNKTQKTISLAIGGALALSVAVANAAENPFALKTLATGYQVADAHDTKAADGKCGTGKCGTAEKAKEMKMKDAKCGTSKTGSAEKAKEGSCGGEKAKEGSCSGEKK